MTCIADANVLFALLVRGHAAYEVAKAVTRYTLFLQS
jgi:hypothetical protein